MLSILVNLMADLIMGIKNQPMINHVSVHPALLQLLNVVSISIQNDIFFIENVQEPIVNLIYQIQQKVSNSYLNITVL